MRNLITKLALISLGILLPLLILVPLLPQFISIGRDSYVDTDLGIVQYTVGDSDLFAAQYGLIAPPTNPNELLSEHRLAWDSDGFRIPANPADSYDIVALGDSYTEASGVALPWTDVLANQSGMSVRNLGYRGYGPQEYVEIMREYGVAENPDVVVIGFFGGNDIASAGDLSDDFLLPALARQTADQMTVPDNPWDTDRESYQYPVYIDLQGELHPTAFLNAYVGWMNITQGDLYHSANITDIRESWRAIVDLTHPTTCVIVAYFPSKPQVYLPHVIEEDRPNIYQGQIQRVAEPDQAITFAEIEPSFETLLARIPNTSQVLAQVAHEENILFLDLLPIFQDAASNSEMLYPSYDTHWNQAGHNLAGAEINQFIAENCPQI